MHGLSVTQLYHILIILSLIILNLHLSQTGGNTIDIE